MKTWLRMVFGLATVACMFIGSGVAQAHGTTSGHPDEVTCKGGAVAPGTYESLTIMGVCDVPSGKVTAYNVHIGKKAAFFVYSSSATLVVRGNVRIDDGGTFVLGCLESGCTTTHDVINGNVLGDEPFAVIFHHNTVNGNVLINGGGGGLSCAPSKLLMNSPVFSDFEDNDIDGNVMVSGMRSCWFGFIRDNVHGNVILQNNRFALPDAMEIVTNVVRGNLICLNNHPAAHVGDSHGAPNKVTGNVVGECKAVSVHV